MCFTSYYFCVGSDANPSGAQPIEPNQHNAGETDNTSAGKTNNKTSKT